MNAENSENIPDLYWNSTDDLINKPIEYIKKPPQTHQNSDCGVELIILVKSSISHINRRAAIRESWSNYKNTIVSFLIGVPEPDSDDEIIFPKVLEEEERYKDLIIGDFWDTYRNLTAKSTMGLQWASEQNYGYLALVDDDVTMDITKLQKELSRRENGLKRESDFTSQEYVQCLYRIQNRARVLRRGKWTAGWKSYPAEYYPKICSGAAMLIPNRAVSILHISAKYTPTFWIDDVYFSGIIRAKTDINILGPGTFRDGTVEVISPETLPDDNHLPFLTAQL